MQKREKKRKKRLKKPKNPRTAILANFGAPKSSNILVRKSSKNALCMHVGGRNNYKQKSFLFSFLCFLEVGLLRAWLMNSRGRKMSRIDLYCTGKIRTGAGVKFGGLKAYIYVCV